MAKTQSLIFTIYGDYIRYYNNRIWVGSLIRLLGAFEHNPQSVRMSLSRMSKQGWLSIDKEGKKSFYTLTESGKNRLNTAAGSIFDIRNESWDGHWLMVVLHNRFDDARHRRAFIRELEWLGFGQLSTNVYITPKPLHETMERLTAKYDQGDNVDVFSAEYTAGENSRLIQRGWNIEGINERYENFFEKYSRDYVMDRQLIAKGRLTDTECFIKRVILTHEYRKFLSIDPGFPAELLPGSWLGHHAGQLFSDYYQLLEKGAIEFFESVFKADNEHDTMMQGASIPTDSYIEMEADASSTNTDIKKL